MWEMHTNEYGVSLFSDKNVLNLNSGNGHRILNI